MQPNKRATGGGGTKFFKMLTLKKKAIKAKKKEDQAKQATTEESPLDNSDPRTPRSDADQQQNPYQMPLKQEVLEKQVCTSRIDTPRDHPQIDAKGRLPHQELMDCSPEFKKPKYSEQISTYMAETNMKRFNAQQKYQVYSESQDERVRDHPYNLASISGGSYAGLGANALHPINRGDESTIKQIKATHPVMTTGNDQQVQPFRMTDLTDTPQQVPSTQQSPEIQYKHDDEEAYGKNKKLIMKDCVKCGAKTLMTSLCSNCEMIKFETQVKNMQKQFQELKVYGNHDVEACDPRNNEAIPGNEQTSGIAMPAENESKFRPSVRSKTVKKFDINGDDSVGEIIDDQSSAGGGSPNNTSQITQGGTHGAQLRIQRNQQHAFIFQQSEETQKGRQGNHGTETGPGQNKPSIGFQHMMQSNSFDSLPFSLKDSQDSPTAKNQNTSRYGEDSQVMTFIGGEDNPHNITHERHSKASKTKPIKLRLTIGGGSERNHKRTNTVADKSKGLLNPTHNLQVPEPDLNLQVPTTENVDFFERGNRPTEAKTFVHHQKQYSFADDLKRQSRPEKESPDIGSHKPRNPGFTYHGSQFLDDEFSAGSTDRRAQGLYTPGKNAFNTMTKNDSAVRVNPFNVVIEEERLSSPTKMSMNRMTSNFGHIQTSYGNKVINGNNKFNDLSQRAIAQSQEPDVNTGLRILTTELPESELHRPLDSARNGLLSSHNEEDEKDYGFTFSNRGSVKQSSLKWLSQASGRFGSAKGTSGSVGALQVRFADTIDRRVTTDGRATTDRRVTMESNQVQFEQNLQEINDEEAQKLKKRMQTIRLTMKQVNLLRKKYIRWRDQLSQKERLMQQQLHHSLFIPTFNKAQVFFSILSVTFVFLGFLFYFSADILKQKVIDYGDECLDQGRDCTIEFTLNQDLKTPHIYYELDKFYSNYRSVVTTAPLFSQLRGEKIPEHKCQGVSQVKDLLPDLSVYSSLSTVDLATLDPETHITPCGLLPKYVFTDTFQLWSYAAKGRMEIDESNITRDYLKEHVFKSNENEGSVQWLDPTNEHFIVWQQMDTLNKVFRLYGRMEENLKKGERYVFQIDNSYDQKIFDGKKRLYLQEVNQLGGPNKWLGFIFLSAAVITILIQLSFLVLYVIRISNFQSDNFEDFYDPDRISW